MFSVLDYVELWSGEWIPMFGRTYCLRFYARNGGYIALLDAGTHHSLEDHSMIDSCLFTESFGG